jgi:heterodisulfide reductase subunit A
MDDKAILVVGAGIAGIEASLILANAGKKIHLIERDSFIGGNVIKYEDVFSNMECATCMIAPKQQELLQNENITLHTLSQVKSVKGSGGDFIVTINKKARYVSLEACIGCNACFDVCPVSLANEFEQGLGSRKAIYTPCAGALPNVPMIDIDNCLRFKNKECEECKNACMFEAVEYDQKDQEFDINVEAIILATGFTPLNPAQIQKYGYGATDIYSAFEFERLYASNGPTEGKLVLKSGDAPQNAAIVFGVGLDSYQCPSSICTMYSLKFIHYLRHKIPEIKITELYRELCVPCKSCAEFLQKMKKSGALFIRAKDIEIKPNKNHKEIKYSTESGENKSIIVDMVIIATPMMPQHDVKDVAGVFGISQSKDGFFSKKTDSISSVMSEKQGIFIIGCAGGAKNIEESITDAQAAAGRILSRSYQT